MTKIVKKNSPASSCCEPGFSQVFNNQLFKALSDSSRVAVLMRLVDLGNEKTVTEIAACCPQSLSVVSRHLKALKDSGILSAQKKGKEVIYSFRNVEVAQELRKLADYLEHCC